MSNHKKNQQKNENPRLTCIVRATCDRSMFCIDRDNYILRSFMRQEAINMLKREGEG